MPYEEIKEVLNVMSNMIDKTDHINQKLTKTIIIMSIAYCLTFACVSLGVSYFYFCNPNSTPNITQNMSGTEGSNANLNLKGGNQ